MKSFPLVAALLWACQAAPAHDPGRVAEEAARSTRAQKSYQTRFKAKLTPPQGDALHYDGTCVSVSPGIVFIHYTASGGDEKNIVRAGDRVWVLHSIVGWTTADEAGMPGAARGIQNPDEILSVLARHSAGAKLRSPGVVDLVFAGEDIEKIMKEQAQAGAFVWKESQANVSLEVDADSRLKKFTCDAVLKPADPNVKGTVRYQAEVETVSFNQVDELKFTDEEKKPVPLRDDMRKAIQQLKEKR
jgi:hypothetical protein